MSIFNTLTSNGGGIDSSGTDWVRFTDGTQICWGSASFARSKSASETFSKSFLTTPTLMVGKYYYSTSTSGIYGITDVTVESINTTRVTLHIDSNTVVFTACFIAIGRWK